ncbi:MAG: tRNA lysidine(34) synthetase TilS [Mycoplasma sp.]|nr:tRNA lysidine(34) synthetase TilS [Candidatus Hennigella equi]
MKLSKKKYIAAVSGGPDSMALLDKFRKNIVGVCHVNYHKRIDSDTDMQIVRAYCKQHKVPLAIFDVKPNVYKQSKQHNFQTLARTIRYEFFVKCGKKFKCNNLLVAHNLNDFLETAIMQQNRKSLNFFYGIKQEGQYKTLKIYRPLLKSFKSDLEKYCQSKGVAYAIDSTNAQDIYERNRIRKQLANKSKTQLLAMYKKFVERNKQQANKEKETIQALDKWQQTNYKVSYVSKINKKLVDSVIYLFLKNNNITVNYNKIKLVRDYIVSKKSNNSLRLEDEIKLVKKDKKVKIVKEK